MLCCDDSRATESSYSDIVRVLRGQHAADAAIIALCHKGDIVVTEERRQWSELAMFLAIAFLLQSLRLLIPMIPGPVKLAADRHRVPRNPFGQNHAEEASRVIEADRRTQSSLDVQCGQRVAPPAGR